LEFNGLLVSRKNYLSFLHPKNLELLCIQGLKPLDAKKLKRWRETVGARANEILPSSSTTQQEQH
jgi:hypothetical protein